MGTRKNRLSEAVLKSTHNLCFKAKTRFDVYETLCPQQMLVHVHKGGQIENWSGECRDIIPTKLQCQTIQRALQSPNLQREIIRKKNTFFKFSPIDLLIILYQLTKFEAPSCYSFSRYHDYKFSKSKSAKGDKSKKIK